MLNRRRSNAAIFSAIEPVIGAMYAKAKENEGAGGGASPPAPPPPPPPDPNFKVEMTAGELEARVKSEAEKLIGPAVTAALDKQKKEREQTEKDEKEKTEADEARKRGEFETLAQKETDKREKAERERDEAQRVAQLLEVQIKLRDHLADDETRKPYLANATDIMLHIEKKLEPDAKPEEIENIVKDETAAFIARTSGTKAKGDGAGGGPARGKLNETPEQRAEREKQAIEQRKNQNDQPRRPRRFYTMNRG